MMMQITAFRVVHELLWYLPRPEDALPHCCCIQTLMQSFMYMNLFDSFLLVAAMDSAAATTQSCDRFELLAVMISQYAYN